MVKDDVLKNHVFPDVRFRMAPFPEATDVAHLMVGLLNPPSRNDICEAQLDIP